MLEMREAVQLGQMALQTSRPHWVGTDTSGNVKESFSIHRNTVKQPNSAERRRTCDRVE